MPKDDWQKAAIKDKIRGQSYEKQQEAEASRDAAVDGWIARQEAPPSPPPRKKRRRRKKGKKVKWSHDLARAEAHLKAISGRG